MRGRFIKQHECIEISPHLARLAGVKRPRPVGLPGSTQARGLIFLLSRFTHAGTRHRSLPPFQGGYYQVLALALHTETQEQLVIYQSEQDGQVYARPVAMFMEWIEHQGQVVSRFTPVA